MFKHFDRWRIDNGKPAPETLTRDDLRERKAWTLERFSSNTSRKTWVRVGAMSRYLLNEDVIERDPTHGIKLPKLTKKAARDGLSRRVARRLVRLAL